MDIWYNGNSSTRFKKVHQGVKEGKSMAMQQGHYNHEVSRPKKRSRLIIDIVPELRRRIKIAAAENDLTVQEYVGRILEQTVPPERDSMHEQYGRLNRAAVDKLLQTREAIMRAHPGQVFEDSSELIHQAQEERSRELEQR